MVLIRQLFKMFSRSSIFFCCLLVETNPYQEVLFMLLKTCFSLFLPDWFYLYLKHTNAHMLGHKQPQEKQEPRAVQKLFTIADLFHQERILGNLLFVVQIFLFQLGYSKMWGYWGMEAFVGWISRCALIQYFLCGMLLNFFKCAAN